MNSAEYVSNLITQLKTSGVPLSDAAWETAKACVGWAYVFGAAGAYCTPANRRAAYASKGADHPTIKSACQVIRDDNPKTGCSGCKWYPNGQKTRYFDCQGYVKWLYKQIYGWTLHGGGCTSQWNNKDNWTVRETIDTIPEDKLVQLFQYSSKTGKMEHTGLGYHGETVECQNGVQYFSKRNKKWTHWAIAKCVSGDVPTPTPPDPDYRPTLRKGDSGTYVTLMQTMLIQRGYSCGASGADGKFGNGTLAALRIFQRDNGLTVDGVCGKQTWAKLESTEPTKHYTVTITGLMLAQAEGLVNTYDNATMREE